MTEITPLKACLPRGDLPQPSQPPGGVPLTPKIAQGDIRTSQPLSERNFGKFTRSEGEPTLFVYS